MSSINRENSGKTQINLQFLGIAVISLFLLGMSNLEREGKQAGFQEINQNRITGSLINVPLRDVLSQLQENLGIEYLVADEELDKSISVELSGETLIEALPKILASWDYALQKDQNGQVRRIYIVKKSTEKNSNEPEKPLEYESEISGDIELSHQQYIEPAIPEDETPSEVEESDLLQEEDPSNVVSLSSAKLQEMLLPNDAAANSNMDISPSASPSMDIIPASSLPEMNIIPASSYPPMEILPVSEEDRKAFEGPSVPAGATGDKQSRP